MDAGNFAISDLFTDPNYFGPLSGPDASGNPVYIVNSAFASLMCNIGSKSSNTPRCLSRIVGESLAAKCTT
jgi:hypothetical protein